MLQLSDNKILADMKNIEKALQKADTLRGKTDSAYISVLKLLLPHLDFDVPSEWDTSESYFHVEYQPSDGIVVGDNDNRVYSMFAITNHIEKNGKFNSLEELIQHCSI